MVEHATVNRVVVGSSPTSGAIFYFSPDVESGDIGEVLRFFIVQFRRLPRSYAFAALHRRNRMRPHPPAITTTEDTAPPTAAAPR